MSKDTFIYILNQEMFDLDATFAAFPQPLDELVVTCGGENVGP